MGVCISIEKQPVPLSHRRDWARCSYLIATRRGVKQKIEHSWPWSRLRSNGRKFPSTGNDLPICDIQILVWGSRSSRVKYNVCDKSHDKLFGSCCGRCAVLLLLLTGPGKLNSAIFAGWPSCANHRRFESQSHVINCEWYVWQMTRCLGWTCPLLLRQIFSNTSLNNGAVLPLSTGSNDIWWTLKMTEYSWNNV